MKKYLYLFLVLIIPTTFIVLSGCLGKNESYIKLNVSLDMQDWSMPDTVAVNTPFDMYVASKIENSCISNVQFTLSNKSEFENYVLAVGVYENSGEACTQISYPVDSTLNLKITKVGTYYFYYQIDDNIFTKDSIVIKP
jgi:hypothetical protein